jgi:hypothetical protein
MLCGNNLTVYAVMGCLVKPKECVAWDHVATAGSKNKLTEQSNNTWRSMHVL